MRILVATDGSAHSKIGLQQCREIALETAVEVTILTVVRQETAVFPQALLQNAIDILGTAVSPPATLVRHGDPAEEIIAEINSGRYEMLIIGESHSPSLINLLLGSKTQRILAHTNYPVFIAKTEARPLKRLLVCDSGAELPNVSARLAASLPALLEKARNVTVLHVMSQIGAAPGVAGRQLRADAAELIAQHSPEGEWLTHNVEELDHAAVQALPKIRHGLVIDEIMEEMEDGRYDLIIIGNHQKEGWQRLLLENVAQHIVTKSSDPVLVCP